MGHGKGSGGNVEQSVLGSNCCVEHTVCTHQFEVNTKCYINLHTVLHIVEIKVKQLKSQFLPLKPMHIYSLCFVCSMTFHGVKCMCGN
jgi:hypothetical protein